MGVEAQIQVGAVVGNVDVGLLGGGRAIERRQLDELGDVNGGAPHLVIEVAIDQRGAGRPPRPDTRSSRENAGAGRHAKPRLLLAHAERPGDLGGRQADDRIRQLIVGRDDQGLGRSRMRRPQGAAATRAGRGCGQCGRFPLELGQQRVVEDRRRTGRHKPPPQPPRARGDLPLATRRAVVGHGDGRGTSPWRRRRGSGRRRRARRSVHRRDRRATAEDVDEAEAERLDNPVLEVEEVIHLAVDRRGSTRGARLDIDNPSGESQLVAKTLIPAGHQPPRP